MSEDTVIRNCSPTLANLKTGNLFCCRYQNRSELTQQINHINRILTPKGVVLYPLSISDKTAQIYCFRISKLKKVLYNSSIRAFLQEYGYESWRLSHWEWTLPLLAKRMGECPGKQHFPHEIGIFLDYPLPDVQSFIENNGQNYHSVGYWKVYHNPESAHRTFSRYRKCTDIYYHHHSMGKSIEQLTVKI